MTHESSHVIILLAKTVLGLDDRLEHLSDEQREKVLKRVERANRDLLLPPDEIPDGE